LGRQRAISQLQVKFLIFFEGFRSTLPIDAISFFEERNNIKVNVFMLDEKYDLFPASVGEEIYPTTVDLLLVEKEIDELVQGHCV
jgi:hypothetical protein